MWSQAGELGGGREWVFSSDVHDCVVEVDGAVAMIGAVQRGAQQDDESSRLWIWLR